VAATVDFDWGDLLRPEWVDEHPTLFVRGYVVLRADETGFTPNPKIIDLGETRIAIFVGHIKFLRPHDKRPVFEADVTPGTPVVFSVRSPAVRVAGWTEADVSDERLTAIRGARDAIDACENEKKNRILLSLRWFENATMRAASSTGVDVFLTYWVALEALAMPDTTSIGPLHDALGAIYGVDRSNVANQFLTGKLYRLRGMIVHDGKRAEIRAAIPHYLDCLYVDVLFHELGLPSEQRATNFLASYPTLEKELDEAREDGKPA
jgi:Apea-like HEPN